MESMQQDHPFIGEVRGMGLMQAFELVKPDTDKTPDVDRTSKLVDAARMRGLLLGKGGLYGNTVRIAPHLNVNSSDMTQALEIIAASLKDIA
jgi:4-aminobutyrate aminotransferase-like enzyme